MKKIIEKINLLLSEKKPIQLHLGCGKRFIPGFLHIDFANFPHVDLVGNVSNLSFINDNSVDLIYACHVLEYFDIFELKKVLKEWYRVLKKGSILRVSVPDFDKVIEIYKKYENMELLYGFLYGRYSNSGDQNKTIYHKMIYTHKTLKENLITAGFKSIKTYDWEKTIHKNYDDYSQAYIPHMEKNTGLLMSLNVEAYK